VVLAIASMIAGNLLALLQQNVKRLLAYSSIAHFGYLLVSFMTVGKEGTQAAVFYLLAYSIALLAAFGVIILLSTRQKEAEDLSDYRGLFWKRPVIAAVFTIALLSLAGIPLTAGFPAKFFVLASGVRQHLWLPVIVLVLTSIVGFYYYLRVIGLLFAEASGAEEEKEGTLQPFFYAAIYTTLVVLTVLSFWLGILPGSTADGIRELLVIG